MTIESRSSIFKSVSRRAWLVISGAAGVCVFVCALPILLWVAGSGVAASLICTPEEALVVAGAGGLLAGGIMALRRPAAATTDCACTPSSHSSGSEDYPIACDLTVFTASERAEHKQLGDSLFAKVTHVVEHSDGFTLSFALDATVNKKIDRWLAKEKQCCPFFSFEITRDKAARSLGLQISGPPGAKAILRTEFEARELLARIPVLAA